MYSWTRTIYNGYEPDNIIRFVAEREGNYYFPFEVSGELQFRDGSLFIRISRNSDGTFSWKNDNREGTASSFEEAWQNLPAFVTDPDHFEESEVIQN